MIFQLLGCLRESCNFFNIYYIIHRNYQTRNQNIANIMVSEVHHTSSKMVSVASSPSNVALPKTKPSMIKSRRITIPEKIDFLEFGLQSFQQLLSPRNPFFSR